MAPMTDPEPQQGERKAMRLHQAPAEDGGGRGGLRHPRQNCRQALLPDRSRGRRQGMLRADGCIEPIDEACEVAGKVRIKRVTGGEAGSDWRDVGGRRVPGGTAKPKPANAGTERSLLPGILRQGEAAQNLKARSHTVVEIVEGGGVTRIS